MEVIDDSLTDEDKRVIHFLAEFNMLDNVKLLSSAKYEATDKFMGRYLTFYCPSNFTRHVLTLCFCFSGHMDFTDEALHAVLEAQVISEFPPSFPEEL